MQAGHGLLHLCHRGAQVSALQVGGDHDQALQILAANFVLRRKLLDGGQRAERGRVARELLKTVSRMESSD